MLYEMSKQIEGHTICALADGAAWPVQVIFALGHVFYWFNIHTKIAWKSYVAVSDCPQVINILNLIQKNSAMLMAGSQASFASNTFF